MAQLALTHFHISGPFRRFVGLVLGGFLVLWAVLLDNGYVSVPSWGMINSLSLILVAGGIVYAFYGSIGKGFTWFTPLTLSLACFIVFIASRILLYTILGLGDAYRIDVLNNEQLSTKTVLLASIAVAAYLVGWGAGASRSSCRVLLERDGALATFGMLLWTSALPFHCAKIWWFYSRGGLSNYLAFYTGDLSSPPVWITLPASLVTYGYFLYIAGKPSGNGKWLVTAVQMIVVASLVIRGTRGEAIVTFITIFWLWSVVEGKRPSLPKAAVALVALITISSIVGAARMNDEVSFSRALSDNKWFLYSQGASIVTLNVVIEHDAQLFSPRDGARVVLAPFHMLFHVVETGVSAVGNDLQSEATQWSLAHKIAAELAPSKYQAGQGVGTSAIAEAYVCGGIAAVFIVGFLNAELMSWLAKRIRRKANLTVGIIACLLPSILFAHRETLFYIAVPCVKVGVLLVIYKALRTGGVKREIGYS